MIPTFRLADIPDDWEIRLREDFVDELDRLNRPWRYTPGMKQGFAPYWRISTVRGSTRDKLSPEEAQQYKEHLLFSERMWTFRRKRHSKGGKKYGIFILKSQIKTLREGINIEDSELEKVIIGFRPGIANVDRSITIPRLPITANRWWAWLLGFYLSTGTIRFRDATKRKRMKRDGCVVRLRAMEPVIPMVERALLEVGIKPFISDLATQKISTAKNPRALRTKRLRNFRLGWSFFIVMKKFGLPTEFIGAELPEERKKIISRTWKPKIPNWIKDDDDYMQAFFEGYVNGGNSSVALTRPRARTTNRRAALGAMFYLRPKGFYKEDVRQFAEDMKAWIEKHGIHAGFREFKYGYTHGVKHTCYEISIGNQEGLLWLMNSFDIQRPDIRAKLFARLKSYGDPVVRWALQKMRSPDNAVFGMLLEEPLTGDELEGRLQMQRVGIIPCLVALQRKGLIVRRGARYFYDPEEYVKITISKDAERMEILNAKAYKYSERLLHRCSECGRVFVNKRDTCGKCGGEVTPVDRMKVLASIHIRRWKTRLRLDHLKEALE